ncbi:hypothetical protein QBC43DRAFT_363185 [Cladorrhinum sp. PSN259]|nr:hypothetical protein QBC43DRAFT_363185 [Cladorrhinum sp. PSN259]
MARQLSVKRRTKKVLKDLSNLQDDDYSITAQTLLAAKHLLRHSSKCYSINITEAETTDEGAIWIPRDQMPNFILSQLEAQRLTDFDSDPIRVSPLVAFVVLHAAPPTWQNGDYPTLFTWYNKPKHRYFCLFAYIKHKMSRRTYTISELLAFRGNETPPPSAVLALADNPELVEIVRESSSESLTTCKAGMMNSAAKNKDRSSTSSDELLFKGTMSRRALHREMVREAAEDPPRDSTRSSIREAIREIGRGQQQLQQQPVLNPACSTEWKYRGRSDSETPAVEPIQAPGGLSAQKSEGFQRFYKAVVSPTHVRVTAGGRIVPNTRGPPSPTTKRTADSPGFETQGLGDKPVHATTSLNQVGIGQQIPVMPQFVPGYPPGFQPIQTPVSFMPMAFGPHMPHGFSFPQPVHNPAPVMPTFPIDGTLKDMHNTKPGDVQIDGHAPDGKQEKLKISPPEFFDYTKPYYYNGQIIYPVSAVQPSMGNGLGAPMANTMMPIPMFGGSVGVPPQIPGQMMHPQPNGMANNMSMPSFGQQHHRGPIMPTAVAPGVPANANFNAPTAPPPSSIKLSEITKKQIAGFKAQLRWYEDQMQYNRHQIDEKEFEHKIQEVKGNIVNFEGILKSQLEYEDQLQRRVAMDQSKMEANPHKAAGMLTQTGAPTGQETRANRDESDEVLRQRLRHSRQGINTNISEGGKAMFNGASDTNRRSFEELIKKPSLSTEAALAPVFEPRRFPTPTKSEQDAKLEAQADDDWLARKRNTAPLQHLARSVTVPYNLQGVPYTDTVTGGVGNIGRATHSRVSSQMTTSSRASFGVPYLLGSLPRGVNPRDATDYDYVYSRPLTDDEQRARFLYWGKAPKSATRGLPKFDGKHFYPASPVREGSKSPAEETVVRRVPNVRPEAENEFRQTKSDIDPFRPTTPIYNHNSKAAALHASEDGYTMTRHTLTRNNSFDTQVLNTEDVTDGEGGGAREATEAGNNHENSADAASLGSFERRSERSGARLPLKTVLLKKGPTSSALSSTMAQGLLHHYAGHAAASLSPSISKNQAGCGRELSPGKLGLESSDMTDGGGVSITTTPERVGENCPPSNVVGSVEEHPKVGMTFDLQG